MGVPRIPTLPGAEVDIPKEVARLYDLAYNLWWSWNADAVALFRRINPDLFEALDHSPIRLIGATDQSRFEQLEDEAFDRIGGGEVRVQRGVRVQQPQRDAVGRGAAVGEGISAGVDAQVRRMHGQRPLACVQTASAVVQGGAAGERAQRRRAQFLDLLLAPRLLLRARAHGVAHAAASRIQDSSSSSPKQRW